LSITQILGEKAIFQGAHHNHILTHYYSFHGIGLRLSSDEPALLEILAPSLKHFRCRKANLPSPCIRMSFMRCEDLQQLPLSPKPNALPVSSSGHLKFFAEGKRLFTVLPGKSQVLCQLDEGRATGFIHPSLLSDSWTLKEQLFYPPLAELLKQEHIFNLHGALAANRQGRAILISAPTGRGKSTTLVNLVRAGYSFLSDDISLLKKDPGGLLLLGFPEPVSLTPNAVADFPELQFLKATPKPCPNRKHSFCIEEAYRGCLRKNARPGWIVFPRVQAEGPTRLLPLPKSEALSLLIPQSVVIANKAVVKEHLAILTQLVEECPCFRLQLGREAREKVPQLFAELR